MLILVGRRRVLTGFVPVGLALVGISAAIAGPGVLYSYPSYLLELNRAAGVGMVTAQSMPNLRGALTALVGRASYPGPIHWILLPVALAAMLYPARIWRAGLKAGFPGLALGYSLALVVSILTSYYAYCYDLTLLLIPVVLLGGEFLQQASLSVVARGMVVSGLLLLICTPLYWALILRWDRPYLLVIPVLLLGIGMGGVLRQLGQRASFSASDAA